ncbi:MAG: hypothetical protein DRP73_00495 [Candidatus Omnitrophota bacterium]|nr:MAG: hypothetical protein DRP73_00495 [Candidatus Omnitrophota bacterium]
MNRNLLMVFLGIPISGCAGNYVYSQERKGRLGPEARFDYRKYSLHPLKQEEEKEGIKIRVEYIPYSQLNKIFQDKETFGRLAGDNPYPPGIIVFKVRVKNESDSKIYINPEEFVLLDDLGTQYMYINPDKIIDIYQAKSFLYSFAKSTSDFAPGIYGAPAGLVKGIAGRGLERKRALLKSIELTGGYVFPGVIYDGFVSFLIPNPQAENIRFVLSNIKTAFDVNDEALGSVDFVFKFQRNE